MRLKAFLYHFLVATAIIVLLGTSVFIGLKQLLHLQMERQLRARAQLISLQLGDPNSSPKDLIDRYGVFDGGAAWIVNRKGEFVAFPDATGAVSASFDPDVEKRLVNPRAAREDAPVFIAGDGPDRQMVYSEKLESGNFLVAAKKTAPMENLMAQFTRLLLYASAGLMLAALYVILYLSHETLKPLFALQEYARNLALGEYIDRAEALKEPDVTAIATILERFYIGTRQENALDKNPMSGLPGNKSLYDTLFGRIESQAPFAVAFLDVNGFTAYNTKYGPDRGDDMIRFLAITVLKAMREHGNEEDRVFHLGADRFIFTTTPDKVSAICEKIIDDYDSQLPCYYDDDAREKGYIISADATGATGKFPFMPICIGVATNQNRPLTHPLQIGHIVGQIRTFLRNREGSDYFIDRRLTDREEEYTGTMAPFSRESLEEAGLELQRTGQKKDGESESRETAGQKYKASQEAAAGARGEGPEAKAGGEG